MYYFVEFLRATRCLRIVGVILGLLLLAGIVFRLSFITSGSPESYLRDLKSSPTAHVTQTKLADGSIRETVDDPQRNTHAVIVHTASGAFTVDVTEPAKSMHKHSHDFVSMGNMSMNEETHNGMSHVTLSFRHGLEFPWTALFIGSMLMGFIVATILAGPLAKENDGHLELAWTKPFSRENYALAAVLVDGVTIFVSQLLCIAVALLCTIMWTVPRITLGEDGAVTIALAVFLPLAWYACLTAFSASLKRGPGLVVGLGWLGALVIPAVAGATDHVQSPVAQVLHAVFLTLCYIDPIVYVPNAHGHHFRSNGIVGSFEQALLAAVLLFIGYIALAVLQWRRVEA